MYVYSRWVLTNAVSALIDQFAEQVGPPADVHGTSTGDGRLQTRSYQFSGSETSDWGDSETTARWNVGVADLQSGEGARLVGVLSATAALTTSLVDDLLDLLERERAGYQPVEFSMRALLGNATDAGLRPTAVRLRQDTASVLVQSEDENALRENLAALSGEVAGVTVAGEGARATLVDGGFVIFTESSSFGGVLDAMRRIDGVAAQLPVGAT